MLSAAGSTDPLPKGLGQPTEGSILKGIGSYFRRNPQIVAGFGIIACLLLFWIVGSLVVGTAKAVPLSGPPDFPPSRDYPLGTDSAGRQLLPVMIAGTPLILEVGLLAGGIGLAIGIVLGFSAGYFGGVVDAIIRGAADIILPIPALAVLVVL